MRCTMVRVTYFQIALSDIVVKVFYANLGQGGTTGMSISHVNLCKYRSDLRTDQATLNDGAVWTHERDELSYRFSKGSFYTGN